jgi:4-diphosphocytidyl-2-C-methyl-D-erythritol kinase
LALELGSDVPFFIHGKTSWAEGRGEILSNYPYKERFFLLSFPELKVSTKEAFKNLPIKNVTALKKSDYTDNQSFNSFESWIRETSTEMEKQFIKLSTIGKPRLSGTGSTIFIEFNEENSAKEVLEKFPHLVFTKSLERSPLMQIIE